MILRFSLIWLVFNQALCAYAMTDINVRVLLAEFPLDMKTTCTITSPTAMRLFDDQAKRYKRQLETITVTIDNQAILINDLVMRGQFMTIVPTNGYLSFQGKKYDGSLVLYPYNNRLLLINVVDLEQYLVCVLCSESWPGWRLETNKALAIASRTYAVNKMIQAKEAHLPYHIKNTNIHQVYRGIDTTQNLSQAVEQTHHLILAYNKRPIVAMFDSCCGGVTASLIEGINKSQFPYLARNYPCHACKTAKVFNWRAEYTGRQLYDELQTYLGAVTRITDCKIARRDAAGLVRELSISDGKRKIALSGSRFYTGLKKIRSSLFTVTKKGNKYIFKGKGVGHHRGLCQWGCCQLIQDGWDYQRVLQFYYPGTELMRLRPKMVDSGA